MRLIITLDKIQEVNLKAVLGKVGGKAQDLFRSLLAEKFMKEFPAYKMKGGAGLGVLQIPSMAETVEQVAERLGGVINKDGTASFTIGALKIAIPINNTREMLEIMNQYRVGAGLDPIDF